jgi:hypothetical protein
MELARCDFIALGGVLLGKEGAHIFNERAGYCGR